MKEKWWSSIQTQTQTQHMKPFKVRLAIGVKLRRNYV